MASLSRSDSQPSCVVCCHDTKIWAVGECNHPTCLLCCARLRVLCEQKDCPVCRHSLKQIVVVSKLSPFQSIPYHDWRYTDRRFNMYFRNRELYEPYRSILDYRCQLCPQLYPFKSFRKLREHANKVHDLHFCDICMDNLKLFPSEFKMYTRAKLLMHRREGDADDTSYRGHPSCEFCDERYLDKDALHSHLRKHHFWCHFCESDGRQDFYPNLHALRLHFRDEHYLCEEGDCRHDVLTAAFRNEIDLKAHCASAHSQGMSKAEVKKMRNLPVEFFVQHSEEQQGYGAGGGGGGGKRRGQPIRGGGGSGGGTGHYRSTQVSEQEDRQLAMALSASSHQQDIDTRNKAAKRPPPARKKLCAQRDSEPPPGFGGQQGTKKKTEGGPRKMVDKDKSRDKVVVKEEVAEAKELSTEKVVISESWPTLATPSASQQPLSGDNRDGKTRGVEKKAESSAPPVTPPPGYARTSHPPNPPPGLVMGHIPNSKPPASTRDFPPLSSLKSDPPLPAAPPPASKTVGGSKVFEEIRQALDYDKEKFKEFQSNSGWFRSGVLTIGEYDSFCKELFGPRWQDIGPLIAKVMPQGKKREELVALFAQRGVKVGPPEKMKMKKAKKGKTVPNAWSAEEAKRGVSEGGASEGANWRTVRRGVSDEDYPSLSMASKLPPHGTKSASAGNVWKVPIHS